MPSTNRFTLTPEALAELAPEICSPHTNPCLTLPGLDDVLRAFSPLPRAALFLGVANDGLPVLLNLRDPIPGSILIVGDADSGKTSFLQTIAHGIDHTHEPEDVRYTVITEDIQEWERLNLAKNCEGILSFRQPLTSNYLVSLTEWAHSNRGQKEFVVILADGLNAVTKDRTIHQAFRWLLLRGPARRIWPIVTLSAQEAERVKPWLESFRTRLCGQIINQDHARLITGTTGFQQNGLLARSQFAVKEGNRWLPFWLPNLA